MAETSTIDFEPAPRAVPPMRMQTYALEMPKPAEEQVSGSKWQKMIPIAVVVLMVILIVAMMAMGMRRFSPMYLMFPLMMVFSLLGLSRGGLGGTDASDINSERKNWYLSARETRKKAQAQGASIHRLAVTNFPNPSVLGNLSSYRLMWQVRGSKKYNKLLAKTDLTDHPYLAARAGVGLTKLTPSIQHGDINVPESYEPVTASAFGRFLQVQKYVANTPIGIRFDEEMSYGFRGDDPALRVDAVRPMIMSLAQNHSPNELAIGVICDANNPDVVRQWEWIKWLPHSNNTMVKVDETLPYPRLAWGSIDEFGEQMKIDVAARKTQGSAYAGPHLIVFIDTPDKPVTWPSNMFGGVPGITFVAVRFSEDRLSAFKKKHANLISVQSDGTITVSEQPGSLKMDRVSLLDAENFARNMARYLPPGFGTGVVKKEDDEEKVPSWYSFLGIGDDLEDFDPRVQWAANSVTHTFRSPIGYRYDMAADVKHSTPLMLDMIELALGGTGPHGVVQGITGSGKSFLLQGIVLGMCAIYGPDKVSFILADFKGGAAFDGYEKLPHVIAVITNLEEEKELVDRADAIINGEITRRQRLLRLYACENAVQYRDKRRAAGDPDDMPMLPDLFIFVDEFYEFMKTNRQYTRLFSSVGAVGRSLGIHMIPCSQFIDEGLLGDLSKHIMFGISLTAADAASSRKVVGTDDAVRLKKGTGRALIKYTDSETEKDMLEGFVGFAHNKPYVTKGDNIINPADPRTGDGSVTRLPFGLLPTEAELLPAGASEVKVVATEKVHDVTLHDALLKHLCKFQEVQAPVLWQPSITIPMTMADTTLGQYEPLAEKGELYIRLGDLDDPLRHARPPFLLHPMSCIGIYGDAGTGKSMTIMTMVASTALAYKDEVSWSLVDYRGGLAAVEHYPNVSAYATKHDTDITTRIFGEAKLKLALRERIFADNRISDPSEYILLRRNNEDIRRQDACGYMMVAIDGIDALLGNEDDSTKLRDELIFLALNGPKYGIFLVATTPSPEGMTHKLSKHFNTTVLLRMVNPAQVTIDGGLQAKDKLKTLPVQPGRGIDPLTGLASLIMVPRATPIPPDVPASLGQIAKYEPVNSAKEIRAFGQVLSRQMPAVEKLAVIGDMYTYVQMWDGATSIGVNLRDPSVAPKDRWLPLGVDVGTLRLTYLRPQLSPHLIVSGDPDSGRTATLRELITTITNQYTPSEAKFVIADPSYRLLNEMSNLVADGYMKPDSFAADAKGYDRVVENLEMLMRKRIPSDTPDHTLMENRNWFQGPEIFVIINSYHQISGAGSMSGPFSRLAPLIREAPGRGGNIGVHFFVAMDAKGSSSKLDREKLLAELVSRQSPILMLSGPSDEVRITPLKLKYEKRRQGRGLLYVPNPTNDMLSTTTVQVAWTDPMEPVSS